MGDPGFHAPFLGMGLVVRGRGDDARCFVAGTVAALERYGGD
jgi:hypothetical protein